MADDDTYNGPQLIKVGDKRLKASSPKCPDSDELKDWEADEDGIVPFWWVGVATVAPNMVSKQITLDNGVSCTVLTNPKKIPAFEPLTICHQTQAKKLTDLKSVKVVSVRKAKEDLYIEHT